MVKFKVFSCTALKSKGMPTFFLFNYSHKQNSSCWEFLGEVIHLYQGRKLSINSFKSEGRELGIVEHWECF